MKGYRNVFRILVVVAAISGFAASGSAHHLRLDLQSSHHTVYGGPGDTYYIKVGLLGTDLGKKDRAPLNITVVLDRSGSMSGEKIERAKRAAKMLVEMLDSRDIFSMVTYDSTIEVLVPPTRMNEKEHIRRAIDRITPRGLTALYGGVQRGIELVSRNRSAHYVNRILLLSDGLANVGPTSSSAITALGVRAGSRGIAITTIGIGAGYNEDLMSRLALASDGNHAYARNGADLERIFVAEIGDALSVSAQDVAVTIVCPSWLQPLRVVDREAQIQGQRVRFHLNQVYGKQEKFLILAVKLRRNVAPGPMRFASVNVAFRDMKSNRLLSIKRDLFVNVTNDRREPQRRVNKPVMVRVAEAIANETSRLAVTLRDRGRVADAKRLLEKNSTYLQKWASKLNSSRLKKAQKRYELHAQRIGSSNWNHMRKAMRKSQYRVQNQMSY
ncbi:MAG: VWA domain-containing protein [Myxococcales bacterium]|nr:VWA domain-containing protein [Myxococcales bacterium]